MKITKEKWNSKAYRWISVIMVLLLVLAPVGVFGVRLNVDAEDASQTYTGTTFTLRQVGEVYQLSVSSETASQEPINIYPNDSGTIILNPVSGKKATLSISSNVELPYINIVCSEGVSVSLNNNVTLNSFQVSSDVNLGGSELTVHTATLNNTTNGTIVLQDSTLPANQTEYGSLVLTGTNTNVAIKASSGYQTVSSEGGFTLKGLGGDINVPGPVSGQIGVWSGLWPYLNLSDKHFYEGAEYNLMNYFVAGTGSFSSDNCSLQFRDEDRSSSIISTGMPRYTGNFAALIISTSNNWHSEPYYFSITTFPGVDLIVSEVDEEGYVTVSAPEGYRISTDNETFVSSIPYTEDQLYTEDGVFDGETLNYYIRVESGEHAGAVSDSLSYSVVAPGLATADFHPQEEIIPDDEEEVVPDEEEEEVVPDEEEEVVPEEEEKEEEPKEEEKKEEFKPADESGHSGKTDNTSNTTTVSKPSPNITLTLDDQLYGLTYAPSFKSDSTGSVKYLYSKAGENKFSEAKPTEPGKYVCRALQEGTDKFGQGTKDVNFSILYLAAPTDAYSISGKKGNNGYYVSDVYLTAPDGYSISLTLNGTYEDKVQVSSEKTKYIYLKRKSDGAMTDGIGIKEGIKVDAKAPVVSGKATDVDGNEVALGGKIYSDKVSFKMADEHLSKVTVNGEEVTVTDGAADISLDANNRHMVYKISAEDEAGNIFTFTVDVYAPWMESGVIPAGVKVGLEAGSTYKLEAGEWATDVDSTVYTGGMDFYVAEDMELTFIKVK